MNTEEIDKINKEMNMYVKKAFNDFSQKFYSIMVAQLIINGFEMEEIFDFLMTNEFIKERYLQFANIK